MGPTALGVLVLCSVSTAILVPTQWSESEVNEKLKLPNEDVVTFSDTEIFSDNSKINIPVEYFQYPAQKPQFAIDVAAFHGVKNPDQHYSAYPVHPYTGLDKPVLGRHKLLNENNPVFEQFQKFAQINEEYKDPLTPASANYQVFHPYKAEEPALQELYKDPVLDKIRNDIYYSQKRLQNYEKEAGEPNIQKGEYLESLEQTDRKKNPIQNVPVAYEVHRPQRRPAYYRRPLYPNRDNYLNHRFRHPWNQHNIKIRPLHYRPLKTHLQKLRHNQALKYDDERNEYPEVPKLEEIVDVPEGYDIYQRGKEKYVSLRNNVDESINNAVQQNHPVTYQKLELQNNDPEPRNEEDEFIPIKNYAQVRKTETTRHLPKSAALEEADSLDEIKNAPRLREAIKSTRAQTVYTEEGYEDAAYDHEGEEKHAAENEAHGGKLKEKEISGGNYKTPSENQKYQDASGNIYRDQKIHGEKWNNDDKEKEKEVAEEDYDEDETEKSIEAEVYDEVNGSRDKRENVSTEKKENEEKSEEVNEKSAIERKKRENLPEFKHNLPSLVNNTASNQYLRTDIDREKQDFKVPEINLNTTFLSHEELLEKAKLSKLKEQSKKASIKEKYPYYFKNLQKLNKDSPLRYSENLKFIPKKTKGGTEFYDSRSQIIECPEIDVEIDPIPEGLKKQEQAVKNGENDEKSNESKPTNKADFSNVKKGSRLGHLGDKIDCYKAKFFGENPLDSPFFEEEIISNPEPVTVPNAPVYNLKSKEPVSQDSASSDVFNIYEQLKDKAKLSSIGIFEQLKGDQELLKESLVKNHQELRSKLLMPQNMSINGVVKSTQQSNIYNDVMRSIQNNLKLPSLSHVTSNISKDLPLSKSSDENVTYTSFQNKEDVTRPPEIVRKRRSAPFIYEPYKIIKDIQTPESKKTTTTNNVSPLIKQLQSSKIHDRVNASEEIDQPVKRNAPTKNYKDIGRSDREKNAKPDRDNTEFVDVNIDSRRGEPRYEVRVANHKAHYTPVENKKSMTPEDYQKITHKEGRISTTTEINRSTSARQRLRDMPFPRKTKTTPRPFFDVSQYIPRPEDVQKPSASKIVNKVVKQPESTVESKNPVDESKSAFEENDDYEEYDDEDTTTTTTTTSKPSFRRRRPRTTTTPKPATTETDREVAELPKLRLITRFNTTPVPTRTTETKQKINNEAAVTIKHEEDKEPESPKYREKKKKSSKSTLMTDTKTYGDGNDDMMKEEIDAMIGVKQDMDDYKPNYEKEIDDKDKKVPDSYESSDEYEHDPYGKDSDEISDEDESESEEDESESEEIQDEEPEVTTPTPIKQTLSVTTQAPISTTEARSAKLELRPIIHKKKIEIHKELPYNKSSPHVTQFKQDIKEIEIIREMPSKPSAFQKPSKRIPQKNLEAFELYKDDKLAEEVNKLGAVEVFKQNLDLKKGPKHGGNYRSAKLVEIQESNSTLPHLQGGNLQAVDPEASPSKNEKLIDTTEMLPARRHNGYRSRLGNSRKNARLDDSTSDTRKLHGGNLKPMQDHGRRRGKNSRSEKLIELDEGDDRSDSREDTQEGNFKSYDKPRSGSRSLHGGNYRSAKLVQKDKNNEKEMSSAEISEISQNPRTTAAVLLNTFAQAAPHLTTTPAYILDPSKRMYYYVDPER